MTWINTVSYEESAGDLRNLYDRIKGPDNNVDNIMLAHSLRPHTMQGHMTLYKYVLHHPRNALPKAYLEAIGVYVSSLNDCQYCVEHHFAGMARLLNDDKRAANIREALQNHMPADAFSGAELAGLDDGEILEINQVTAYFSYANRTVLGLGVATDGDIIGLSPGDSSDPDNWSHA